MVRTRGAKTSQKGPQKATRKDKEKGSKKAVMNPAILQNMAGQRKSSSGDQEAAEFDGVAD